MISSRFSRFFTFSLLAAALAFAVTGVEADLGSVGVIKVYGSAQVERAGGSGWITANERMRLRAGDRLRTNAGAWCYIEISEGNVVKMTEKSSIVLEGIENTTQRAEGRILFAYRGTGAYNVKLENGHIMPILDRFSGSSMRLSTPVAVAGVRGTVFEATVEAVGGGSAGAAPDAGGTYNVDFTVHRGAVEVTDLASAAAGPTYVPAGYSMTFQNVRVPAGGFSSAMGGPGGGRPGGQGVGGERGGANGPGRQGGPGENGGRQQAGQPGTGQPGSGPDQGGASPAGGTGRASGSEGGRRGGTLNGGATGANGSMAPTGQGVPTGSGGAATPGGQRGAGGSRTPGATGGSNAGAQGVAVPVAGQAGAHVGMKPSGPGQNMVRPTVPSGPAGMPRTGAPGAGVPRLPMMPGVQNPLYRPPPPPPSDQTEITSPPPSDPLPR